MDLTMEQRATIEAQIRELETKRAQYVEQANREIAFCNGQIQALQQLLAPAPKAEPEVKPELK